MKFLKNIFLAGLVSSAGFSINDVSACSVDPQEAKVKGQNVRAQLSPDLFKASELQCADTTKLVTSTKHLKNGGVSGHNSSILVLDVAFSGHKDIKYDVDAEALADISRQAVLAHGTTVSCTAAGRSSYGGYEPVASGAAIIPFLSNRRSFREDIDRGKSTINGFVFNAIEAAFEKCRREKKPMPRVLNMSLAMVFEQATLERTVENFTQLLEKYDLLVVKAIGNIGDTMHGDFQYKPYGAELDPGFVDIASALTKYPRLLNRMILVGSAAYNGHDRWSLIGTNKAGVLADHVVFAETNVSIGGRAHNGTSHSTPKVTSFATAMGKYFPERSMVAIKEDILSTARTDEIFNYNKSGKDPVWGRGIFCPGRAWHKCVREMGLLLNTPRPSQPEPKPSQPKFEPNDNNKPAPRRTSPEFSKGYGNPIVTAAQVLPKLKPHLTTEEVALIPTNFNAALCAEVYKDWVERTEAGQNKPNYQAFQMSKEEAATFYFFRWIVKRLKGLNFNFLTSPSLAPADFDAKKYLENYPALRKEAEDYLLSPELYARLHYVNIGYWNQYIY